MAFHVKRTVTTTQTDALSQYNGMRSTRWVVPPPKGKSVLEIQETPNPRALQKIPEGKNYLTPGPHWHWYQEEQFHVRKGRFIFDLEGKQFTVSESDPMPVIVPARARHSFKADETCEGPCVIEITADAPEMFAGDDPEDHGMSERFFRNIYSYMDDCYFQNVSPSIPQIMLMADAAECGLGLPGPGWLMRPISYVLGVVVGRWWAQYVLGYKSSYPEYYDESRSNRKLK